MRQAPGGIHRAKQNVGDGVPAFFTRPPRLEHCGNIFGEPGNRQRSGTHLHNHGAGICGKNRFHKFFLRAGQTKRFTVTPFLLDRGGCAHKDHRDIGVAGQFHGLL